MCPEIHENLAEGEKEIVGFFILSVMIIIELRLPFYREPVALQKLKLNSEHNQVGTEKHLLATMNSHYILIMLCLYLMTDCGSPSFSHKA